MREVGKVRNYDGYFGEIINEKGDIYLLKKEEIEENSIINNNDLVSYVPEHYKNSEIDKKIARFVKKVIFNKNN